jgi:hypothetical protein
MPMPAALLSMQDRRGVGLDGQTCGPVLSIIRRRAPRLGSPLATSDALIRVTLLLARNWHSCARLPGGIDYAGSDFMARVSRDFFAGGSAWISTRTTAGGVITTTSRSWARRAVRIVWALRCRTGAILDGLARRFERAKRSAKPISRTR